MVDKKSNTKVMKPGKGDVISVRHLQPTDAERKENFKNFREHKETQKKIKDDRFAAIEERTKGKPKPSGGRGGGKGINLETTRD